MKVKNNLAVRLEGEVRFHLKRASVQPLTCNISIKNLSIISKLKNRINKLNRKANKRYYNVRRLVGRLHVHAS